MFDFRVVKFSAVRRIFLREQKYDASHRFSRDVNIDGLHCAVLFPFEGFEQRRVVVPQLSSSLIFRLYLPWKFFTFDGFELEVNVGQFVGSDTLTGLGEQNFAGFRKLNSVFHIALVVRCVRTVSFENFSEFYFQNLLVFFQKNVIILSRRRCAVVSRHELSNVFVGDTVFQHSVSLCFALPKILVGFEHSLTWVVVNDFATDLNGESFAQYPSEVVFEPRLGVAVVELKREVHRVRYDDLVRAQFGHPYVKCVVEPRFFFHKRGRVEKSFSGDGGVLRLLVAGL